MSVRRALTGALTASLLLLSACGGDDSSVADPPVSSTTSSPTQAPHRESPEHFIRRWANAEKRMENTGETAEYLAMSRGCKACLRLISDVQSFYGAGGFIHWGGLTVLSVTPSGRDAHDLRSYKVRTDSKPTRYRERAGGPLRMISGGVTTELLTLKSVIEGYVLVARSRVAG